MPELSQADYEAAEVRVTEDRERFLATLTRHENLFGLYRSWQLAERDAFEARRARREAEVRDG